MATVADRPVNLHQWRRVAGLARRIHIAPNGRRWFSPSPVCGEIKTWARQQRFDVLLAASHRAWPVSFQIQADMKLCDLSFDLPDSIAEDEGRLTHPRLGRDSLPDAVKARMARVIRACDTVLVSSQRQADALRGLTTPVFTLTDDHTEPSWNRLVGQASDADLLPPSVAVLPVQPTQLRKAA